MSSQKKSPSGDEVMRWKAFARWENEGGATAFGHERPAIQTLPSYSVVYQKEGRIYENANTFWKILTEN